MLEVFQFRKVCAILTLLAGATCAFAQSNGVPGPEEYSSFSRFITDRNIFDPNRQPHNYDPHRTYRPTRARPRGTPGIQLVGTMSYNKGMFAFFNGNSADLSKVLQVGNQIAGYTIMEITANSVELESADQKEQPKLQIGDGLREENGKWVLSGAGDLSIADNTSISAGPSSTENASSVPSVPPSANEQNDVIKRLMQQREKENQ